MQDASEVRTIKLYDEDAYRTVFEARVLSARFREDGDGRVCDLVLDRTCFFPEEGGQCPDRGTIAGLPVTDVQIRDGLIHHTVLLKDGAGANAVKAAEGTAEENAVRAAEETTEESAVRAAEETAEANAADQRAVFAPGMTVEGRLDWPFRFSNMQQHSGEHLVSGIVHRLYGFDNVGFHLSSNEVTMDYSGVIPEDGLLLIEEEANRAVWSNIPSVVRFTEPEERKDLSYRSKLDLEGTVRIVTYPGVDSCACCAPHVRRTGEIGLIKISGMINWKGGVRMSIVCGDRALRQMQELQDIVTGTAGFLTTAPGNIYPQVVKMKEEIRELKSALRDASVRELLARVKEISPGEGCALLFSDRADLNSARAAVNAMTERCPGLCAVFSGTDETQFLYAAGSRSVDCRQFAAFLKQELGAKGGGKADMVQGSVCASEEEIRSAVARFAGSGNV